MRDGVGLREEDVGTRVRPELEGASILVGLPGSSVRPGPLPRGTVDSDGIARAGSYLPGRYLVRLLVRGEVRGEQVVDLAPDPDGGAWRLAPFAR